MADLAELLIRPIASVVLRFLRALLWLGWDIGVSTIGWSVGWCICRVLSFGRFPSVRLGDEDAYDFLPCLLVEVIGLLALALCVWWLSGQFWGEV